MFVHCRRPAINSRDGTIASTVPVETIFIAIVIYSCASVERCILCWGTCKPCLALEPAQVGPVCYQ